MEVFDIIKRHFPKNPLENQQVIIHMWNNDEALNFTYHNNSWVQNSSSTTKAVVSIAQENFQQEISIDCRDYCRDVIEEFLKDHLKSHILDDTTFELMSEVIEDYL